MEKQQISLNPNSLVSFLQKPSDDFTKNDIIRYVTENNIKMINLRYVGGDYRLKTLNFVIQNLHHLNQILTFGERVDGSSLFSHIEAGASDLYVIPKYRTAFLNPFSEIPTVDILCSYFNKDGEPLTSSPENIMIKAHQVLKQQTGLEFEVMGELEYYLISPSVELYPATDQKGYHESAPFVKWEDFRAEAMLAIAQTGGQIKYGHSEVGNFTMNGLNYEQNEIEFTPAPLEKAADQLYIAKWILRKLALKYRVNLTFAPKITSGKAGSGFHIHTKLTKNGKSVMLDEGKLSLTAKKLIAGYLSLAPSLTAFGNSNPTSYFRLVPNHEAPTNICWGDRNRSVLIRVPLGWTNAKNMICKANPHETCSDVDFSEKQTVEFRCPDGSADIYLLLAGLTVAACHGLEMANAIEFADQQYVDVNIFEEKNKEKIKGFAKLPVSCHESAIQLEKQTPLYLKNDVFTQSMIDGVVNKLNSYHDEFLMPHLQNDKEGMLNLVNLYFHCG